MDVRYSPDQNGFKRFTTEELRKSFLIESLFGKNQISLVYSDIDRSITGSAVPSGRTLMLTATKKEMAADYFTERRELGIINIGDKGAVLVDGKEYKMANHDGLYVGRGLKKIEFKSTNAENPAMFYFVSYPAHISYPDKHIKFSQSTPKELGSLSDSNKRTIYKFIHPGTMQTCQLVMGLTKLERGRVVSDGSLADTVKATITVNRKPGLGSRTPAAVTQDSRNGAATFTAKATDPDGNRLTFTWKVNGVAEAATGNTLTKTFTDAHNTLKTVTAIFADPGGLKDSTTWSFTITPVEGMEVLPTDYALGQNYPNPFNPATTISYALPKEASVTFEIYNRLGVRIRTLLASQTKNAGFHTMSWDGMDEAGNNMSSGIYLYRISAGSFVASKKMTLLK